MKIRVADYIAQHLELMGVTHVFWLTGGAMMHLIDAVAQRPGLQYVCHHHEQSCAYAADAYARQKESLGVCYATGGPGGLNTVTGIVSAYQDSSPVLFLTGQAKLSETIRGRNLHGLRQCGTFEVDIIPIVQSVTKYSVFLDDPKLIKYHLEKAIHLALSGRPGPVLIDIPVDIQGALIDPDELIGYQVESLPSSIPSVAFFNELLDEIKSAKRPMFLAGHGIRCAKSVELFQEVLTRLNIPTATTQLAKDLIPYAHELFVGHPGMKGDRAGNFIVQNADLILVLGCSLHSMTTGYELDKFAPQAKKIQIDLDEMVLKRENVGVQQKIQCSIQDFLMGLLQALNSNKITLLVANNNWHQQCVRWKSELAVQFEPHKKIAGKLNYYEVIEAINHFTKGDEVIVADAGSAFYTVGQACLAKKGQRYIFCGALAQMGYTSSAVIGAAIADPTKTIIGITGDGSLQTNLHDLGVYKHYGLNIKLIVVNNLGYASIRNTQTNYFNGRLAGTDTNSGLSFPNLHMLCQAYGLTYVQGKDSASLMAAFEEMFQQPGPAICEVFTSYELEIIPSVSSVRLEDGRMQSKPLQDMYPFLSPEKLASYMLTNQEEMA